MPEIIKHNAKHIIFASMAAVLLLVGGLWFVQRDSEAQSFRDTDLNQDGVVDQADVDLLRTAFDTQDLAADFNNDGQVNTYDLFLFNQSYGDGDSEERDFDQDKYSVADNDCDDTNPNIHPFKPEEANGIDDNCNGAVDEFVDFKPVTTNLWYQVPVQYVAEEGGQVDVAINEAEIKLIDYEESVTNMRSTGNYAFLLLGADRQFVDAVYFDVGGEIIAHAQDKSIETNHVSLEGGTEYIYIPKVSEVEHVVFVDTESQVKQELDFYNLNQARNGYYVPPDAAEWRLCPRAYRPDASGYGGVMWCKTNVPDEGLYEVLEKYKVILSRRFELAYYGLNKLQVYYPLDTSYACGNAAHQIYGCYFTGQNGIAMAWGGNIDSEKLEVVFVHELAHRFQNLGLYLLRISTSEDDPDAWPVQGDPDYDNYISFLKSLWFDLVAEVNDNYCTGDEDCNFAYVEFVKEWETGVEPDFAPIWRGGCDYVECEDGGSVLKKWRSAEFYDPLVEVFRPLDYSVFVYPGESTSFSDDYGPRPFQPGSVSAYAAKNPDEGFAETYESWYMDEFDIELPGAVKLCDIFNKHIESGYPQPNILNSLAGLRRVVGHFGKAGLIEDRNHNGIPDSCDPEAEPTETLSCVPDTWCSGPKDSERYQVCLNSLVDVAQSHPNMKPGCKNLVTGTGGAGINLGGVITNGCSVGRGANDSTSRPWGTPFSPDNWREVSSYGRGTDSPCGGPRHSFYTSGGCTLEGSDGVSVGCWRGFNSSTPSYGRW